MAKVKKVWQTIYLCREGDNLWQICYCVDMTSGVMITVAAETRRGLVSKSEVVEMCLWALTAFISLFPFLCLSLTRQIVQGSRTHDLNL